MKNQNNRHETVWVMIKRLAKEGCAPTTPERSARIRRNFAISCMEDITGIRLEGMGSSDVEREAYLRILNTWRPREKRNWRRKY